MENSQALQKWCPFVRHFIDADGGAAAINRRGDKRFEETAGCIGRRCMAWREHPWNALETVTPERVAEIERGQHPDWKIYDDGSCTGQGVIQRGPWGGYCGLAGSVGAQ